MVDQEIRPRNRIRNLTFAAGFLGISFVCANALLWQSGPHPAPLFGGWGSSDTLETGSTDFLIVSEHVSPLSQLPDDLRKQYYRDVQSALKSLGYYSGDIDGITGPMTRSAISAFQTTQGIPATGEVTFQLFQSIRQSAHQASQNLGSAPLVGEQQTILSLQRILADLGYAPGPVNGELSTSTEDAIRRFEADRGMPLTGQVSDIVLRELSSVSGVQINPKS